MSDQTNDDQPKGHAGEQEPGSAPADAPEPLGPEAAPEESSPAVEESSPAAEAPAPAESSQSADQVTLPAPEGGGVKQVGRPAGGAGRKIRVYWPFGAMAFCTLALAVAGYVVWRNTNADDPKPDPNRPAGDVEVFRDDQAGFTIRYPKDWRRIPVPPEAQDLRLVLSAGGDAPGNDPANPSGGADGMWIRVFPPERIDQKINEFSAEIQALTGGQPCGAQGSPCLRQEQVTVGGLTGVRYVYVTKEEASGQDSVHLQYFLRRGAGKLYVIVFQALPRTDLPGLAPAFDQVLFSFQALEEGPGPTASTTTTTAAR